MKRVAAMSLATLAALLILAACSTDPQAGVTTPVHPVAGSNSAASNAAPADTVPNPTAPSAIDPGDQPIGCVHEAGTGDLATDLMATWSFAYNATPWNYTFQPDGTATGHQGVDYEGPSPVEFETTWVLADNTVTLEGLRGPEVLIFRGEEADGWRVARNEGSTGDIWRRCPTPPD
ncbi:MAG: hypothetical protein HKN91_13140 [Acidimicrobiia bacterium]|nr:hypothetical protein [Acidimicrobiia bacterium]